MKRTTFTRLARSLTVGLLIVPVAAAQPGPAAGAAAGPPPAPVPMPSDPQTNVGAPTLSFTGRYVAHIAVRRDQSPSRQQVRRTDMTTGASELLNPALGGGVAPGNYSMPPVISGDGSRTSFTTNGGQLVAGDTNSTFDAFVRDATADETLLASAAADGGPANGPTGMASLSKNGRYVVFTSTATNIVPGSTTTNTDVFRRDLAAGATVQVTLRPDGSLSRGPGASSTDVSGNGNLVAFSSYNGDLVAGDTDSELDLFVRNMTTDHTRWISRDVPAGMNPAGVVISPNGRWVSSRWDDGSLRLTRVSTGETTLVAANGYALLGSFSSNKGRFVFMSAGQPTVLDLATGVVTAIAVPPGGVVTNVTVSGNGAFAAYDWTPDDGGPGLIFRIALAAAGPAAAHATSGAPRYQGYVVCSVKKSAAASHSCRVDQAKTAIFLSKDGAATYKVCVKFPGKKKLCASHQPAKEGVKSGVSITSNKIGTHTVTWFVDGEKVDTYSFDVHD